MAGAARTGALARHWARQNVHVHILSARNDDAHGLHDALENDHIHPEFLAIDREAASPAAQILNADNKAI